MREMYLVLPPSDIKEYLGGLTLALGQTARFNHKGCATTASSKSLAITRKETEHGTGYVAHCFKCGESGWLADSAMAGASHASSFASHSGSSKRTLHDSGNHDGESSKRPPARATGCVSEFSPKASAWVLKYLTPAEVTDHGILCDPVTDRVWFPVRGGWIHRRLQERDGPKWIAGQSVYGSYGCDVRDTDSCVVTEDVVSAIVCSRYLDAYAACGTNVHAPLLACISRQRYEHCVVFFDDDNEQVKMQQLKAKRQLELACPDVRIQYSGTDPKNLSHEELEEIFNGSVRT